MDIEQTIHEVFKDVPKEVWDKLPTDLSHNHDKYLNAMLPRDPEAMIMDIRRIDTRLMYWLKKLPMGYRFECYDIKKLPGVLDADDIMTSLYHERTGRYVSSFHGTGGLECWLKGFEEGCTWREGLTENKETT